MLMNDRVASMSDAPRSNQYYYNTQRNSSRRPLEANRQNPHIHHNKFESNKLQNNSISSSVSSSSSSSATNSSIGNVVGNINGVNSFYIDTVDRSGSKQFKLKQTSVSPVHIYSAKTEPKSADFSSKFASYYHKNTPIRHSSTPINNFVNTSSNVSKKPTVLSDRLIGAQIKIPPTQNSTYTSLNRKVKRDGAATPPQHQKSSSYTFRTYDPNRLSSYDNNDLFQDYMASYNQANPTVKTDAATKPIITSNLNAKVISELNEQTGILPSYTKRASYAPDTSISNHNPVETLSKNSRVELTTSCIDSLNCNVTRKNLPSKNQLKSSSNNNLFTRALNYAFKKSTNNNKCEHAAISGTWKSKLGKYLTNATVLDNSAYNQQVKSSNKTNVNQDSCEILIDEDLSATYHLSRRNPIRKHSLNCNDLNMNAPLSHGHNSHPHTGSCTTANTPNSSNSNQLLFCISSSSTSSTSNNSASTGPTNQAALAAKPKSDVALLAKSNSNSINENAKYTKKSSSHHPHKSVDANNTNHSMQQKDSGSHFGSINKNLINNGFNSLRKILKISSSSSNSNQTKNSQAHSQKLKNKCLSASTSPLPNCKKFDNTYTASQTSAYCSVKNTKAKSKEPSPAIAMSAVPTAIVAPTNQSRQSILSLNSFNSTPKSSKHSSSINTSNLTKSIVNQASSSFSSASLSSANPSTPPSQPASVSLLKNGSPKLSRQSLDPISLEDHSHKAVKSMRSKSIQQHDISELSDESQQQKNMINMLKVYKNVLTKMHKTSDESPPPNIVVDNVNNQSAFTAAKPKQADVGNSQNSLKNVNKKAKKLSKLSPEEEILCDLEVASYFDEPKLLNDHFEDVVYYYESPSNKFNNIKVGAFNDDDNDDVDDSSIDEDSKNLEYLVRQLAAEAALSTLKLKDETIEQAKQNEFMKNFDNIFLADNKNYMFKNKSFNNYGIGSSSTSSSSKQLNQLNGNKYKLYNGKTADEQLVYEIIENELGLNDVENNNAALRSLSISPNNFKFIEDDDMDEESPERVNKKFDFDDEVNSLFKSNASSSYEVDNIYNSRNWLDSLERPKNIEYNFKNGFLSLKLKPNKKTATANKVFQNNLNLDLPNYNVKKKRSSSSTSFQQGATYPKGFIKHESKNNQQALNNYALNDPHAHIKIEKKIKLNYRRPQNLNSILNFGTLC